MYLVRSNRLLQWVFPGLSWHRGRENKEVYLTFDDGPTPEITPKVLDILKEYDAKATFFLLGKNVEMYPAIVEKIKQHGHTLGNHSYDHPNGWRTNLHDYLSNVNKCAEIVDSRLFRPPYGRISNRQASALKRLGYEIIMWDVLSADFDVVLSPEDCIKNVMQYARNGSIIVFHDSEKAWPRLEHTLPAVLEYFKNNSYTMNGL